MPTNMQRRLSVSLFAVTIFLSAFLLFQVQPLMGKYILPWFGGSPGVWTTCMLVFQLLLFGGYAYAHYLTKLCSPRLQAIIHASLLLTAVFLLPIAPGADWKPSGEEAPVGRIMLLLLCNVGLPYFLLSSTGPLLQGWLSRTDETVRPYRLYALSNIGSMLALLSFPFVFEPAFSSREQSVLWSVLFGGFALMCAACATLASFGKKPTPVAANTEAQPTAVSHPSYSQLLSWFTLAALPSIMLLATTNQVCLDTAVIPFLWVVPLSIYLLTFILTFDSDRWYKRRPYIMLSALFAAATCLLFSHGPEANITLQLVIYFGSLFFSCMVCHGELVRLKPHPKYLTMYYMILSAGGACGGLFVGLLAPVIFLGYFELQLAIVGCMLVFVSLYLESNQAWQKKVSPYIKGGLALGIPVLFLCFLTFQSVSAPQILSVKRNFYGMLRVMNRIEDESGEPIRTLVHGSIVHGSQFLKPELNQLPTTYYSKGSGVGRALTNHRPEQQRHIGIVGLGTGTLATYGKANDRLRFYEINPDVIELAREHFTFLSDTPAKVDYVLGDARLMLEREEPQKFDVLVLDAFSGDAIPVHLLTKEAMTIYCKHLNPDGVLAIHISNHHFDLRPIVAGLAQEANFEVAVVGNSGEKSLGILTSNWVLLNRDRSTLEQVVGTNTLNVPEGRPTVWTDERSNLFEVLK